MIVRRGASAALLACGAAGMLALAGCGSPARTAPVNIVGAAEDAKRSVAAFDDNAPQRVLPAGMSATATATYRCADGTTFTAKFDNRRDVVRLQPGKTRLTWAGQHPATGIWYAGKGGELRGNGRQATLTRTDRAPVECSADK